MTTWVLIIMMWHRDLESVPMQSLESCLAAKSFYNNVSGIDTYCTNVETGETRE